MDLNRKDDQGSADAFQQAKDHQFLDQCVKVGDHSILPIELTNATGTYLNHLNDDCLLKIFSRNSLTPMDLCSLAETCKLFKRITLRVFPKKLAVKCGYWKRQYIFFVESKYSRVYIESTDDVVRMFKHFGSCLVTLSVLGYDRLDVMNLVAKYCVADKLKELEISDIELLDVSAVKLKVIFQKLQLLSITRVSIESCANALSNFDSLIDLRVGTQLKLNEILENNFPQLQRFTSGNYNIKYRDLKLEQILLQFFGRHANLKCLNFSSPPIKAMDAFFRKLGNILMELEEFEITFRETTTTLDFSNFPNLKQLKVCCCDNAAPLTISQLQKLKSLKLLKIEGVFDSKELLEALPLLTNLRELDLDLYSIREKIQWRLLTQLTKLRLARLSHASDNVVDIIRQLPNLEELEIPEYFFWYDFILSEDEFQEIVKLENGRANVLTLKCNFEFSQCSRSFSNICVKNSKVKLIKMK